MPRVSTQVIAVSSVLGALSFISEVIRGPPFDIPFPLLPGTVSWDLTGIPMMISLLLYGPLSGLYTCLVGCSILFFRNPVGGLFKIIAEVSTILAYGLIRKGVIVRTSAAMISRTLVMTVANYYMLQFFYHIPETVVIGLLPPLAIFNLTQALINIIPAHLIHLKLKNFVSQPQYTAS
jgi:riboflavin transporter FmnP